MKVVAIVGSGRSGSTLLSLMLSQDSGVFNLGQSRHLFRAFANGEPCSCGESLRDCRVYGELVPAARAAAGPGADPESAGRAWLKDAAGLADWVDADRLQALASRHDGFLRALQAVLEGVRDATGATHFVDSSKIPELALAFSLLPGVELYALNLVRDPRAVASSWHKKKASVTGTLRNALDWRSRQRRLESWRPALDARYFTLRYEDFAARPAESIGAIADWSGLPIPADLFTGPDRVRIDWSGQHLYAPANERVLAEKKDDVAIRISDGWRTGTSRWVRAAAQALAWPDVRRYYP